MLKELSKREMFILESVGKGRRIVNGQTWKSLAHQGLVEGEPSAPTLTPAGLSLVNKAASEKQAQAAAADAALEASAAEQTAKVSQPVPVLVPTSSPKAVDRSWSWAEVGLVAASVALLICVLVMCAQYGQLQDARAEVKKLTNQVEAQEKALQLAGVSTDSIHSTDASRAETNAKVLDIRKRFEAKVAALAKSKQPQR